MELATFFKDFLKNISPTERQIDDCKTGHRTLRERLESHEKLAPCIVTTFLQGSYRRSTAVRPHEGKRSDVDVVVVTRLDQSEYTPQQAVDVFKPFLEEHYGGKYAVNDRCIAIELSYVDLDLVITSAPSESQVGILTSDSVSGDETPEDDEAQDWQLNEAWVSPSKRASTLTSTYLLRAAQQQPEWKTEPLYIPSRDLARWVPTDPLAQIRWTWDKNRRCNGHYVKLVKALKWWRRLHPVPPYPKGYPLEHLIGTCCPDNIGSVAEGVVRTLENIRDRFAVHASLQRVPYLPDHGVPEHNVLARVSGQDFASFHTLVKEAASLARAAYDAPKPRESAELWRKLFGNRFPETSPEDDADSGPKGGFTPRSGKTIISGGRFA